MDDQVLEASLSGLAYSFVMLGEALARVRTMSATDGGQGQKPTPLIETEDGLLPYNVAVYTTTSDPVLDSGPTQKSTHLFEYRAYFEWALVLARKLSEAVSSKTKHKPTDLRASDLMGDPQYELPALDEDVIESIDKSVAHPTYFFQTDDLKWQLGDIEVWRDETLERLLADLRENQPERAASFEGYLAKFQAEIT